MATPVDRFAFAAAQTARVGWFFGQYRLSTRLSRGSLPPPRRRGSTPQTLAILRELIALFERDWRNIQAGYYRLPHDVLPAPGLAIRRSLAFFADLPAVNRRRRTGRHDELPADAPAGLPDYYRRTFHYQSDGYLSARSARLYDFQVEVLFGGGADAMRRQALVPIAHFLAGRSAEGVHLVDVASGTGRFLSFLKDTHPLLGVTAVDLSRPYLDEARRLLRPWPGCRFVAAPGEAMPLADASADIVTCIYLFHELPGEARRAIARECARVLKPGGMMVFLDSIQTVDRPDFAGLMHYFPEAFHEPYYADYLGDDLVGVFTEAGLVLGASDRAFMSKLLMFRKP